MRSIAFAAWTVSLLGGLRLILAQDGSLSGPGTSQQAANYSCDASKCVLPDCACASTSIPGGIPHDQTPMFLVFTACVRVRLVFCLAVMLT